MKKLMFLALCGLVTLSAGAQKKSNSKKKALVAVEAAPKAVDPDTFSVAVAVAQAGGLKQYLMQREGVDEKYLAEAAESMVNPMDDETLARLTARLAGARIAQQNRQQVVPMLNQQFTGKRDTTYINLPLYEKALADALTGHAAMSDSVATAITENQLKAYQHAYKQQNTQWLEANKKQKDVKTTESGLQYRVLTQGTGVCAADTSDVEVHYEGRLIDGTVFDSSYKRGKPATFKPTQVIKGWTEALQMMPEGSVYELYIPQELGYGERGSGQIPAYSTLIFKVELIKVKP
ncbi:MAG: FKBP-type peptidyl-prolyl cis-trans isomerase [Prevotellaceae bacterium]|nr:FKBP-type peptidyl-prolyl cis-trans isomerase [Prevotellaceae bacterium]